MAEPVRMTTAEFRALGATGTELRPAKVRTTKKEAAGPYRTRCTCGQEFTTIASEDRHVSLGHNRFGIVL